MRTFDGRRRAGICWTGSRRPSPPHRRGLSSVLQLNCPATRTTNRMPAPVAGAPNTGCTDVGDGWVRAPLPACCCDFPRCLSRYHQPGPVALPHAGAATDPHTAARGRAQAGARRHGWWCASTRQPVGPAPFSTRLPGFPAQLLPPLPAGSSATGACATGCGCSASRSEPASFGCLPPAFESPVWLERFSWMDRAGRPLVAALRRRLFDRGGQAGDRACGCWAGLASAANRRSPPMPLFPPASAAGTGRPAPPRHEPRVEPGRDLYRRRLQGQPGPPVGRGAACQRRGNKLHGGTGRYHQQPHGTLGRDPTALDNPSALRVVVALRLDQPNTCTGASPGGTAGWIQAGGWRTASKMNR